MRKVTLAVSLVLAAGVVGCNKDGASAGGSGGGSAAGQPLVTTSAGYVHIGDPLTLGEQAPVPVSAVLANPAGFAGKPIRIAGTVDKVCEKKGCWITMTDPAAKKELFVKFTCSDEGGRIVPMEAKGRPAIVEGTVTVREISEGEARHYAEDEGASKEAIAKIVGPQKQITVKSPAVQIAMAK